MLVLTEAAAEVVKALTSTPQAPEGSGLRIASSTPDPGALQLSAATGPGKRRSSPVYLVMPFSLLVAAEHPEPEIGLQSR
jgi:hypothetical protein